MQVRKMSAALAAVLVMAAPAHADEAQPLEILVPTPLPHAKPVAAKRGGTVDTAALLDDEPGVSLNTGGGVSSIPAIHGLADDRINILVDGMPITLACANHMNPALSYMLPANVSGMGVSGGLAPVSAGGDSIAGTITASSADPVFADPGKTRSAGSLAAFYRSANRGSSLAAQAGAASDRVSLQYAAAQDQAGSYRDGHGSIVRDTLYKSVNQQVTAATRGDRGLLVVRAGVQSIPYQGFVNQYMDMVGNHGKSFNADYRAGFGWGNLDARGYWQDTRHAMGFFTPEKTGTMPMNTRGRDVGYALKAELPLSQQHTLRVGSEFHGFTLTDWWPPVPGSMMMGPNTYVNINHGTRDVYSLYGEMESKPAGAWGSLLGIRAERVRMDAGNVQDYGCGMMCTADAAAAAAFNAASHARRDTNIDLTAVARYDGGPSGAYEFGYARKVRSPNLYERYAWGRSRMAMNMTGWFGDANGYAGNPDLKPEVANTLSVTGKWRSGEDSGLTATVYHTRVQHYIGVNPLGTYVSGGSTFATFQFANQDARIYGADLSGDTRLWGSAQGTGRIRAIAGWTRGTRTDTGASLYHIMPFHARVTLEQTVRAWTHALDVQYVARKNSVDALRNEPVTPAYTLVNVRAAYERGSVRLDFGVDNLFNRLYYLPLGGVDYADWKAGGQTGQIGAVAGMGRSVYAGLTVRF